MSWLVVIKARIMQKAVLLKQPRLKPMPEILGQFEDFCVIIFTASYSLFSLRIFCFKEKSVFFRERPKCVLHVDCLRKCALYRRTGPDCDSVIN